MRTLIFISSFVASSILSHKSTLLLESFTSVELPSASPSSPLFESVHLPLLFTFTPQYSPLERHTNLFRTREFVVVCTESVRTNHHFHISCAHEHHHPCSTIDSAHLQLNQPIIGDKRQLDVPYVLPLPLLMHMVTHYDRIVCSWEHHHPKQPSPFYCHCFHQHLTSYSTAIHPNRWFINLSASVIHPFRHLPFI